MDNPEFVTYQIKMFPSPKKLKTRPVTIQQESRDVRKRQEGNLIFKSTRKLQQYKLIRFSFSFINEIFLFKLVWLVWTQYNEDNIIQNKYSQTLLRWGDTGVYTVLKVTDFGFILIAYPVVRYIDSFYYKLKVGISNKMNSFIVMILPFIGWLETNIFQRLDFIFTPVYRGMTKLSFLKNNITRGEVQDRSGVLRIGTVLLQLKLLLFNYLTSTIISTFTTPVNYLIHINTLFNYQLTHQTRITFTSVCRMCQNVFIEIWLEWVHYFEKPGEDCL